MRNIRLWMVALTLALGATLVTAGAQTPAQTTVPQAAPTALRQFSGSPIDVDYQAANLRTVLRQLSEIGGINLVIDPSVPAVAPVDLKLTQVPWDQVMDVVLRSAQLTYEVEGPVVRVMTREALLDRVWGLAYYGDSRTLDVHIRRLRQKLGEPGLIETVTGVGYRLSGAGKAAESEL